MELKDYYRISQPLYIEGGENEFGMVAGGTWERTKSL